MVHLPLAWTGALAILSTLIAVEATLYESLTDLPRNADYDFIVVGSGPGGATVASRLSEDRKFKVLLVEAGPNDDGVIPIHAPASWTDINTTYKWDYESTPQTGLNGRSLGYPTGQVLGGSSSINGMLYTRGARDDYDLWAKTTGDNGWKWDSLAPYFKKNEQWTLPLSGRNITGQYDPSVHSYTGNVKTSLTYSGPTRFDELAEEATKGGSEFPFLLDANAGSPIGLGWVHWTIGNGERSSAATAYLTPDVRKRRNLHIVVNTLALRVHRTGRRGKDLDIRTVELGARHSSTQPTVKITARKELIVASGTFNTPQLLLNSGIGDRGDLKAVGVPLLHHLPDVGKGMTDHVSGFASLSLQPSPPPPEVPDPLNLWLTNRTGPLSEPFRVHQILFSRIRSNASIWDSYEDPSSGPNAPHIESLLIDHGTGLGTVSIVVFSPRSRGSVKIASADPYAAPLIDLGFYTHPYDVAAMREAYRNTQQFFDHPAWNGFALSRISPDPEDPAFEQLMRDTSFGVWHPVGTAAMSARGAKNGVVDPDLRVKGVKGLRIVDASVIPYVPAAHTQVPVYILAERAADLIKAAWRK